MHCFISMWNLRMYLNLLQPWVEEMAATNTNKYWVFRLWNDPDHIKELDYSSPCTNKPQKVKWKSGIKKLLKPLLPYNTRWWPTNLQTYWHMEHYKKNEPESQPEACPNKELWWQSALCPKMFASCLTWEMRHWEWHKPYWVRKLWVVLYNHKPIWQHLSLLPICLQLCPPVMTWHFYMSLKTLASNQSTEQTHKPNTDLLEYNNHWGSSD